MPHTVGDYSRIIVSDGNMQRIIFTPWVLGTFLQGEGGFKYVLPWIILISVILIKFLLSQNLIIAFLVVAGYIHMLNSCFNLENYQHYLLNNILQTQTMVFCLTFCLWMINGRPFDLMFGQLASQTNNPSACVAAWLYNVSVTLCLGRPNGDKTIRICFKSDTRMIRKFCKAACVCQHHSIHNWWIQGNQLKKLK